MSLDVDTAVFAARALLESGVKVLIATLIVAQAGPKRSHYLLRVALSVVLTALFSLACGFLGLALGGNTLTATSDAVIFSLLLVLMAAVSLLCHDVSALTALCYATVGYAAQKMVQGLVAVVPTVVAWIVGGEASASLETFIMYALHIATYLVLMYVFAHKARRKGFADMDDAGVLLVAALVMLAIIVYEIVVRGLEEAGVTTSTIVLRLVQVLVCAYIVYSEYEMLYNKRLLAETAAAERMLADAERQYELSRETIDAVNRKCHYIRRQIRGLRKLEEAGEAGADAGRIDPAALDALEEQVGIYDTKVHTGNDALDVILSEKRLICEREDIELTCVADGRVLAGLGPADLYAIVGGALEVAIEASRALLAGERTVSLAVREVHGTALLHVESRCAGKVELVDGLPAAIGSKEPDRSDAPCGGELAARSMRLAAERLGGSATFSSEGGILIMDALLPLRESA